VEEKEEGIQKKMHSLKNSGFFLDLSMGVRNLKKVFNFHQKRDHHPP